ncbi:dihydrodipicolinate synthetase [Striga asiatica]|uniref:Dihydrodipicolinate synthetase n=1 Tax=Striga asiatica TaxID=4170 RepID=A0A5A7PWE3_STRAF|nr:dihydrodipicolinate synthetase [Striga asiatica]
MELCNGAGLNSDVVVKCKNRSASMISGKATCSSLSGVTLRGSVCIDLQRADRGGGPSDNLHTRAILATMGPKRRGEKVAQKRGSRTGGLLKEGRIGDELKMFPNSIADALSSEGDLFNSFVIAGTPEVPKDKNGNEVE